MTRRLCLMEPHLSRQKPQWTLPESRPLVAQGLRLPHRLQTLVGKPSSNLRHHPLLGKAAMLLRQRNFQMRAKLQHHRILQRCRRLLRPQRPLRSLLCIIATDSAAGTDAQHLASRLLWPRMLQGQLHGPYSNRSLFRSLRPNVLAR